MTVMLRLTAIALAATLAAGPCLAEDPPGSTPSSPRAPDAGPASTLPLPGPGPTGLGIERHIPPPQPPTDLTAARDAEVDDLVGILLGATDLKYPHDVCYGMITCCNSYWVQGCNAGYFQDVCDIYGGVVEVKTFSDGSLHYECHYAD